MVQDWTDSTEIGFGACKQYTYKWQINISKSSISNKIS